MPPIRGYDGEKDTSMPMHITKGAYLASSKSWDQFLKELKCYESSILD